MTVRQIPRSMFVLVAVTATLLVGCSGSDAAATKGSSAGRPGGSAAAGEATPGAPTPSRTPGTAGFPTCDEVKAVLGPVVGGLIELPGSENGVSKGVDGPELGCAWHTKETNASNIRLDQYGGISIGISRDSEYTEESMKTLGWNVDDPRVTAAGAWALKAGGGYDPADQLDVTGVQVVRDGVVVVLTSGGVVLQDVPQLAALTNEWALGAGVAVLDLMKKK